ncbi:hypothetical protein BKA57DRAFT_84091 [Linnemannia elongata]|nr:hypothetical protein BKA57DRAFT_84091 [Linnemannia elongata]
MLKVLVVMAEAARMGFLSCFSICFCCSFFSFVSFKLSITLPVTFLRVLDNLRMTPMVRMRTSSDCWFVVVLILCVCGYACVTRLFFFFFFFFFFFLRGTVIVVEGKEYEGAKLTNEKRWLSEVRVRKAEIMTKENVGDVGGWLLYPRQSPAWIRAQWGAGDSPSRSFF